MPAWREALQAARQELFGEPYDPERDCTMTEAATALGIGRGAAKRYLTALGWTCRSVRLPNNKWGDVWRPPPSG